jgi:hypothetical protein
VPDFRDARGGSGAVKVAAPSFAFGPPRPDSGYRPVPIRQVSSQEIYDGPETHPGSLDFAKAVLKHLAGDSRFTDSEEPVVVDQPAPEHMSFSDRLLNLATLGEHEHPGDLRRYGVENVKAFDPRSKEGILNWAGLIVGPRRANPRGEDWGEMGFGHPEKEFPSVVPGFTVRRAQGRIDNSWRQQAGDPVVSMSGWESEHFSESPRERGDEMGASSRQGRGGRIVPVVYNWVKDDTGEVVGSFKIEFEPGKQTYVPLAAIKKIYRDPKVPGSRVRELGTSKLLVDALRLMRGAGDPVRADLANEKLGEKLGRLGRNDPMFAYFQRHYDIPQEDRRVTPMGQAEGVTQRSGPFSIEGDYSEPEPWSHLPEDHPFNTSVPTSTSGYPYGSNRTGYETFTRTRSPWDNVAALIEARLIDAGHERMVDDIVNANLMSPRDRTQILMRYARNSNDFSNHQLGVWRGLMTRLGHVHDQRPTLSTAARRLAVRLEEDGWGADLRRIHEQFPRVEDRVHNMLQFMHDQNYHPETLGHYTDQVPLDQGVPFVDDTNFDPSVGASARAGAPARGAPLSESLHASETLAGWMVSHGYMNEMSRIAQRHPESPQARAEAYLQVIRRDPHIASQALNRFEGLVHNQGSSPNLVARASSNEHVARELYLHLRDAYPNTTALIEQNYPHTAGTRVRQYLDLMRRVGGFSEEQIRSYEARLPHMFPPRSEG